MRWPSIVDGKETTWRVLDTTVAETDWSGRLTTHVVMVQQQLNAATVARTEQWCGQLCFAPF